MGLKNNTKQIIHLYYVEGRGPNTSQPSIRDLFFIEMIKYHQLKFKLLLGPELIPPNCKRLHEDLKLTEVT